MIKPCLSERVLTAINLFTRLCGITPVCKADECKALGSAGVSILSKEDPGNTSKTLEDLAEIVFFGEF